MSLGARVRDCVVSFTAHPVWALVIVNSLSLVSDVVDSWRWFTGQRGISGVPANASQ